MAPEDKYRLETFVTESDEAVKTVNRLAIPFLSIPELKEAFYLDDLLMVETEVGTEGFTGLVNVNSDNYGLHNPIRLGSIRSEDESGNVQASFLDAGLNTLGITIGLVRMTNPYGPYLVFSANFKPSYFDASIPKIQYRLQGETNWNTKSMIEAPANSGQVIRSTRFIWLDLTTNNTIEVRSVNSNPEGDYYSPISTISMTGHQYTYFVTMTDACGVPGTNSGTIRTSDYTLAAGAEINGTGGIVIPNGHFIVNLEVDDEDLAGVRGLVFGMHDPDGTGWKILDRKPIGWCDGEDPPPSDWFMVSYVYYNPESWFVGCDLIDRHPEVIGESRVLYFRYADSKYYPFAPTNPSSLPETAPSGIYYKNSSEFFIVNSTGTHGGDGDCTNGLPVIE